MVTCYRGLDMVTCYRGLDMVTFYCLIVRFEKK